MLRHQTKAAEVYALMPHATKKAKATQNTPTQQHHHPRLRQPESKPPQQQRMLPLLMAGAVCATTSLVLGCGTWGLLHHHRKNQTPAMAETIGVRPIPIAERPETKTSVPLTPHKNVLMADVVAVPAGAVEAGENGTQASRRVSVAAFAMAQTEVTNEQYKAFMTATKHRAPPGWVNGEFPAHAAQDPVTKVNWHEATDYCRWLSNEIGAEVRLPSEAEWVLAAGGAENNLYPWGDRWDERAALSNDRTGKPLRVMNYPLNRSPAGIYDLAGNVWEWVADRAAEGGKAQATATDDLRVIKGGAVDEPPQMLTTTARAQVAADSRDALLGFRFVIGGDYLRAQINQSRRGMTKPSAQVVEMEKR